MRATVRTSLLRGIALGAALLSAAQVARAQEPPRPTQGESGAGVADWSGPYVGLEGSAGGSFAKYRLPAFLPGAAPVVSGFSQAGNDTPWLAGGFAGHNWQIGPIVVGIEANAAGARLKRSFDSGDVPGFTAADPGYDVARTYRNEIGSVRGRLGFAVDDYLLYATAGVAGAHVSTEPVRLNPEDPVGPRIGRAVVGATFGFGLEAIVSPAYTIGVDYRRSVFDDFRGPGQVGPLASVPGHGRLTSDDVTARLTWYPAGLRQAPEPTEADAAAKSDWSLHGQTTFIQQGTPTFRSPYSGPFSFLPNQARETWTLTGYLGRRVWEGGEVYFNPELNQGFGLSRTLGIAGYVNGEAQKAGAPYPKFRPQRYFLRQVFGLGGETETVADGLNQIAGSRDIDRITVTVGKFAVGDFFDDNIYAHDPRINFNNWSLWASTAFDFPANLPGFTQGAVVELNRKDWALRAGLFQVPKQPNSDVLDPRIDRKGGAVIEFEHRHEIFGQPGKWRIGVFSNVGRTASYNEAIAVADLTGLDQTDAAVATRRDRRKSGVYSNVEQALTDVLGVFVRASWNDGRTEILSFTDVDRSISGGFSIKGADWGRPKDVVGIGATLNGLSGPHRDFLAAGGLGLLIGDGRLDYRPERAFETYYSLSLADAISVSANYQFVANPGYNADRGPAHVFGARLHVEF